jgi:hypothetical protein
MGRVRHVVEETQVLRHDDERCGLPIGVELNLDPKDHLDDVSAHHHHLVPHDHLIALVSVGRRPSQPSWVADPF